MDIILKKSSDSSRGLLFGLLVNCMFSDKAKEDCPLSDLRSYLTTQEKHEYVMNLNDDGVKSILLQHEECYEKRLSEIKENKLIDTNIPVNSEDFKIFTKYGKPNQNPINQYDNYGFTLLMRAVEIGDVDSVKKLLSKGALPLKTDKSGSMTSVDIALNKFITAENRDVRELYHYILDIMNEY